MEDTQKIVVMGGYGQVGSYLSLALATQYPARVLVYF